MGPPAAMRPTTGTNTGLGMASPPGPLIGFRWRQRIRRGGRLQPGGDWGLGANSPCAPTRAVGGRRSRWMPVQRPRRSPGCSADSLAARRSRGWPPGSRAAGRSIDPLRHGRAAGRRRRAADVGRPSWARHPPALSAVPTLARSATNLKHLFERHAAPSCFLSDPGGRSRPYVGSNACSMEAYADPAPTSNLSRSPMSTATEFVSGISVPAALVRGERRPSSSLSVRSGAANGSRRGAASSDCAGSGWRCETAGSTDPARSGGSCSRGRDSTRRCALACPPQRCGGIRAPPVPAVDGRRPPQGHVVVDRDAHRTRPRPAHRGVGARATQRLDRPDRARGPGAPRSLIAARHTGCGVTKRLRADRWRSTVYPYI